MTERQIITIAPGGAVSGLQRKPGQGLDLTKLGRAEVVRASEIVWDIDSQAWKIDVLRDAGKGVVTAARWLAQPELCEQGFPIGSEHPDAPGDPLVFASYDDAVRAEIKFLDCLRIKGVF